MTSFDTEARAQRARIDVQLRTVALAAARRTAFYAVGAAEALLLDRLSPGWRQRYLDVGVTLAPLFPSRP